MAHIRSAMKAMHLIMPQIIHSLYTVPDLSGRMIGMPTGQMTVPQTRKYAMRPMHM